MAATCAALLVLSGCGSAASRKAGYIAHGQQFMAAHNYDKARIEFSNAAQIDPKDGQVRYLLGQVAEKTGDVRSAAGQYQAAIADDPKLSAARAALGRFYLYADLTDKAMELIEPGLATEPSNPQLLTVRAAVRQRRGDSKAALADAELAVKLAPSDDYAIAMLASLYREEQPEHAIAVVQAGLQLLPRNVELRSVLADLYLKVQQPKEAESQLKQIVDLEPTVPVHRYQLARLYLLQKDVDAADSALRAAVVAMPNDVGVKVQLVEFLKAQRGGDRAIAQIDQMVKQRPADDGLRNALGEVLVQIGSPSLAEAQFRAVIAHAGKKPTGLVARDRLAALAVSKGDTRAAQALIADVLRENPRDNDALVLRSGISMANGSVADAIDDLRAVIRDQPTALPVMRALALAYARNGQADLAEETLRGAVQASPKDRDSRLQLAQLLIGSHKVDQAGSMLQQLAAEYPTDVGIQEALFRVLAAQRRFDEARATASSIQTLRPDRALGYLLAGLLDETQNKPDDAQRDYERALQVQSDSTQSLEDLMQLYVRRKRPDKAMQLVDAFIASSPGNVAARELKAGLLVSQGRIDASVDAYREALAIAPGWPIAYHDLAAAQVLAKHDDDALRTLQQGIEKTSDAVSLIGDLAKLYERLGRIDDAIALYQHALEKAPDSVFTVNNLAVLLVKYKTDSASLALARRLADQLAASSIVDVIDTRGWVKFKSGDFHGAESLLQQAVDKSPDAPMLRYHLGMAQLRSGESQSAQQNLETALRASTSFEGSDEARAALTQLKKTAG